ncbi:MAG: hypothetical protein HYR90_01290 [Candidatus Andersenbacteria bacterium]|nr:hypothetical protein [Candidatus Andersenbacteria bacterium]MBI3250500.1 hypothetical protein [Candidatus Andersenbacteria bacterium]
MLKKYTQNFWHWYERNYKLNVSISSGLFLFQLIHLVWLTADVVTFRLVGRSYFEPTGVWEFLIVFVDYLEIPTLISVSFIYINELRKKYSFKSWFLLLLLNSQWFHIFWITDEVVEEVFTGSGHTVLPFWAAWIAILIDYLELPVIVDLVIRFVKATRQHTVQEFIKEEFLED